MAIPYLNSDESILLSTHNILVDAAVSEAILTNRRFLIIDSDSTLSRHKDISFAAIETVTTMESGSGDPAISLAIRAKSGGTKPLQIVFSQQPRTLRTSERDDWAQKIKDQIALLPEGTVLETVDFSEDESGDLKKLIGYTAEGEPAPAEDKNVPAASGPRSKTSLANRFHPPKPAGSENNTVIAIAAIVIVILLIAAAAFIYPAFMSPKSSIPTTPVPTPVPTTATTIVPVTTAALTPEATPEPTVPPEQTPVLLPTPTTQPPANPAGTGIWVRVAYDKDFTGSVGTAGRMRDVSGTGEHFYQVPAGSTDMIEISIQKLDASGSVLTAEVFSNGELIQRKTITAPKGTLDLNVDLKSVPAPVITPTATP